MKKVIITFFVMNLFFIGMASNIFIHEVDPAFSAKLTLDAGTKYEKYTFSVIFDDKDGSGYIVSGSVFAPTIEPSADNFVINIKMPDGSTYTRRIKGFKDGRDLIMPTQLIIVPTGSKVEINGIVLDRKAASVPGNKVIVEPMQPAVVPKYKEKGLYTYKIVDKKAIETVDFTGSDDIFIYVCAGRVNTGGYRLNLDYKIENGRIIIWGKLIGPSNGEKVIQVFMYPGKVIHVGKLQPGHYDIECNISSVGILKQSFTVR